MRAGSPIHKKRRRSFSLSLVYILQYAELYESILFPLILREGVLTPASSSLDSMALAFISDNNTNYSWRKYSPGLGSGRGPFLG